MPYADDFRKAPLYEQLGVGAAPGNPDEYEKNVAEILAPIGKRAEESMDVEKWQKNLEQFLAEKKTNRRHI